MPKRERFEAPHAAAPSRLIDYGQLLWTQQLKDIAQGAVVHIAETSDRF